MQEDREMTVRERIVSATRRLSAQYDLEHLSFAQIAKEAGVSWATVRRYVGEQARLEAFLEESQAPTSLAAGSDTRSRILAAARRVFAAKGYAGASLDEVAMPAIVAEVPTPTIPTAASSMAPIQVRVPITPTMPIAV